MQNSHISRTGGHRQEPVCVWRGGGTHLRKRWWLELALFSRDYLVLANSGWLELGGGVCAHGGCLRELPVEESAVTLLLSRKLWS